MKDIIVTGGRTYDDWIMVQDILELFKIKTIIQGGAFGADQLARGYAKLHNIECITVQALWDLHGKAAGPIRNREMLVRFPDAIVIAFPGGPDTTNCVKQALELNHIVLTVR